MKIEVLNIGGAVITAVANVSDPDAEVAAYGGHSWRPYAAQEPERKSRLIERNNRRLGRELRRRLAAQDSRAARTDPDTLGLLVKYMEPRAPRATEWDAIKALVNFARTKRAWFRTATEAELAAYDPATDPGWPS